jgi:hypothetical protein
LLAIQPLEGRAFNPPISWENTIGAAIEGGECRRLEDLDQLLSRAGITGDDSRIWRLYLAVLNGQDIPREWVQHFDRSDFADYLAGKTIAIVGPAPTEALDAEEIDRHDLVVRLNHSYEGKGTDPKHKGLRTDIACFNGEQGYNFLHEHNGLLPKDVTWGVFKSSAAASHVQEKNADKHARSFTRLCRQSCFHGSLNMIPIVALDLALFSASSLKVYHADLMLSVARQKGYYPESFNRPNDLVGMQHVFRRSSIVHDPIQQYRILNSLWRNKKITGDARFVEVMKMGLSNYLVALELVYADGSSSAANTCLTNC